MKRPWTSLRVTKAHEERFKQKRNISQAQIGVTIHLLVYILHHSKCDLFTSHHWRICHIWISHKPTYSHQIYMYNNACLRVYTVCQHNCDHNTRTSLNECHTSKSQMYTSIHITTRATDHMMNTLQASFAQCRIFVATYVCDNRTINITIETTKGLERNYSRGLR